jgi:hypothetical protein
MLYKLKGGFCNIFVSEDSMSAKAAIKHTKSVEERRDVLRYARNMRQRPWEKAIKIDKKKCAYLPVKSRQSKPAGLSRAVIVSDSYDRVAGFD